MSRVDRGGGPWSEAGVRPSPRARHARRTMVSPRRQSRGGCGAEASRASLAPSAARDAVARTPAALLIPGGRLGSREQLPRTVLGRFSLTLPGVVHLRDVMLHHRDDHGGGGYARYHAPHRVVAWVRPRGRTMCNGPTDGTDTRSTRRRRAMIDETGQRGAENVERVGLLSESESTRAAHWAVTPSG